MFHHVREVGFVTLRNLVAVVSVDRALVHFRFPLRVEYPCLRAAGLGDNTVGAIEALEGLSFRRLFGGSMFRFRGSVHRLRSCCELEWHLRCAISSGAILGDLLGPHFSSGSAPSVGACKKKNRGPSLPLVPYTNVRNG